MGTGKSFTFVALVPCKLLLVHAFIHSSLSYGLAFVPSSVLAKLGDPRTIPEAIQCERTKEAGPLFISSDCHVQGRPGQKQGLPQRVLKVLRGSFHSTSHFVSSGTITEVLLSTESHCSGLRRRLRINEWEYFDKMTEECTLMYI